MTSVFVVKRNPNSICADTYKTYIPVDKLAMKRIIDSGWNKQYDDSSEWCRMMRIPAATLSAVGHLQMLYKQIKNKSHNK